MALYLGGSAGRAWLMATCLGLEPYWGKPDVRNLRGGAGDVTKGAGLRPTAKAVELPPDPTVGAPVLYPTILEPIFEADFHDGSYGYRPKRQAQEAVERVREAISAGKTQGIDVDLAAYLDSVRQDRLLGKVARRIEDAEILHVLKLMLRASGKRGVPQGGVLSPLLANIYLHEVDGMLERAKEVTRNGRYPRVEYAPFEVAGAGDGLLTYRASPRPYRRNWFWGRLGGGRRGPLRSEDRDRVRGRSGRADEA